MNTNTSNKVLRYIIYVLLGLSLLVPLIVANSMFFPYITGKALTFRCLVEAAFAVWVVLAFRDPSVRPKRTPLFWGITIFTIVAFIVDMTGMNPIRSLWSNNERMEGWITIIHLWAYFIIFSSIVESRKIWHWFINLSFIPATIMAFEGIWQLYVAWLAHQQMPRLSLNLGNAEYLAVYMLFNAFFALYLAQVSWAQKQFRNWTWLYLVLSLLYVITIIGSLTRGTWLGIAGGLFVGGLVYSIFALKTKTEKIGRTIALSLVGLIIVGALGFYAIRNTHFVQNSSVLNRLASISTDNARLQYIWPMAWKGFKAKPILGWGQENFNYVFNTYYDPNAWGQEQWFDRAHNTFIDWSINGGIVGLAAYASIFVLLFMGIWKKDEDGEYVFSLRERSIWTGLVVAYIIHDMFVFDNLASYLMFFTTLAFFQNQWPNKKVPAVAGAAAAVPKKPFVVNSEVGNWIIAPIVIIITVFLLYFFNYRPYEQNIDLIAALENCQGAGQQGAPALDPTLFTQALDVGVYMGKQEIREQLYSCAESVISSQSVSDEDKLNYYELTSTEAAAQAQSTPDDLRGFLFAGSFFNDLGQWAQALPYLQRAYQLSSVKQSILFALGQNYISGATSAASSTQGLALLKQAYDEAPAYPTAQTTYAEGLFVTGNYAESAAIYQQVIAATPTDLQSRLGLAAADEYSGDSADAIAQLEYIASSSVDEMSGADSYIAQIKAGKNPFAQPATSTASTAS
jgi:O-antigen ligase